MKVLKTIAFAAILTAAFAGGYAVRANRFAAAASMKRPVLYYVDPMHPAYTSDKPGTAPDCGMALEPVYADQPPSLLATTGREGRAADSSDRPSNAFRISPARQQLVGVTFATVEWDAAGRSLRTVGRITFDETRVAHVHPRIEGWIEKLFVDFTGDFVKKGEPMLTIYSPEMLASQQELLLASRARDVMAANPLTSASRYGDSLVDAARRRLELWDLSGDQIQQVLDTRQPIRSVALHAPMSGFVLARNAFPNQKVTPDSDLYTIADLSHVWIIADVFESDIAAVNLGDRAYISFPFRGTPPIDARITHIQPQVDPMTRALKVRLEAPNHGLRLKPEMFVNVELGLASPKRLTVPAGAVVDTGDRQTVFVDLGDGYLEPRRVEAGERYGDRIVIVRGVTAGERVVSSGTFLVDSESQLKAAAGGMGAPKHQHGTPSPSPEPGAHRHD